MHRQQLHRVGGGGRDDLEALALLLLGRQVGQQRQQGHVAVDRLEVRHRPDEQVEVVAPGGRGRGDRRVELDVDPGGLDDPPHDVEQGLADVRAQAAQLRSEQREPLQRLGGVRRAARVVERVVEARDLGRVDAVGDGDQVVVDRRRRRAAAPRTGQLPGAVAEQLEVARTDGPPRPGQQGEQRCVGGDVLEQVQDGDDLRDLGQPQQPGQPDDLDRDAGLGQRVEDLGGVRVVPGQDADVGPQLGPRAAVHLRHGLREPGQLLALGLEDAGGDDSLVGLGLGLERPHGVGPVVERRGQAVGDREDPAVGAPVDRERVRRHGPGPPAGNVSAKPRMLETDAPRQP